LLKDKIREKIKNIKFIKPRIKIKKINISVAMVALATLALLLIFAFALSPGFFGEGTATGKTKGPIRLHRMRPGGLEWY